MKIERSNIGPPKQTCTFDTESGQIIIIIEDPVTEKAAAACAMTLAKADARTLADAIEAYRAGGNAPEPVTVARPTPDFVRLCMFHAGSGELAVSLSYKGAIKLAADATIMLARHEGPADAQLLADALREFATR
jgi:hypothetical protein